MEKVVVSCNDFSAVFIDNFFFSSSRSDQFVHVRKVLSALTIADFTSKSCKC